MSKTAIIVIALVMFSTINVSAADVPTQCSLTCVPAPAPATVDDLLNHRTGAVTGIPLSAEADSDTSNTGDFDFVTECLQYRGKVWAWREGKCKSMSPDWKSPGLGNYVKY